jgi:hypothetical protein
MSNSSFSSKNEDNREYVILQAGLNYVTYQNKSEDDFSNVHPSKHDDHKKTLNKRISDNIELCYNEQRIGTLEEIKQQSKNGELYSKDGNFLGRLDEFKIDGEKKLYVCPPIIGGKRKSRRNRKTRHNRKSKKSRKGKSRKNRRKSKRRR